MIVDINEIKDYLRVDDEDDGFIEDLIEISQIYIDSSVGDNYKANDKAVKLCGLLQKKIIADMYDNRSREIPSNSKTDFITTTILDLLSNY